MFRKWKIGRAARFFYAMAVLKVILIFSSVYRVLSIIYVTRVGYMAIFKIVYISKKSLATLVICIIYQINAKLTVAVD